MNNDLKLSSTQKAGYILVNFFSEESGQPTDGTSAYCGSAG